MEKIIINGGNNRLVGTVKIEGAKNAVLPLLAATVLASEGVTTLKNVPVLSDVYTMNNVVRGLNAQVTFNEEQDAGFYRCLGSCLGTQWSCQGFHAWRLYDRQSSD